MKYSPSLMQKLGAVGLFSGVFLGLAAIGPLIILLFNIGVADPVTAGWPLASQVMLLALLATGAITTTFACGLFIHRNQTPALKVICRRSVIWALVGLGVVPLSLWLMEMIHEQLFPDVYWRWGSLIISMGALLLFGFLAGRWTMHVRQISLA